MQRRGVRARAARHFFGVSWLAVVLGALGGLASPSPARAQEPVVVVSDSVQEVRLADGSTLFGRVVEVEGDRVVFVTSSGVRMELQRAQIRSVQAVRGRVRDGEVWLDDPHGTRLFFAPTGRPLAAGEGYFGVYELIFPFVSYGVTDRFTISGGTPIIPGLIGEVFYLAPKLAVLNRPSTQLSLGVLAFGTTVDDEAETGGILYAVGTRGSRDAGITLGAGFPFYLSDDESDIADRPLMMLGGEARVARSVKLLTENYFVIGETGAVISGGARFFGERLSADAGLAMWVDDGGAECCLPVVNFVYSFGRR